ncbi:alpha/beta hydrolase [Streptobacillus canis]|uniref:alpha/beta hydrolase n=1 Tax=Streptobacillus canis TaxID=2678686 RepID=UPI0012E1EED4|nr:alpha/beta hydrolase [Streptobacillus canis]
MNKLFKLVLLFLIIGFVGLYTSSKYYYERSMQATIAEIYLKVTKIRKWSSEEMETWLKERKEMEEEPYILPEGIEAFAFSNMPVLNFNKEGKGELVIYIHGGTYLHHVDPFHIRFVKKLIEQTDAKVLLPVYPKAPKHDFKEAYEKVLELYNKISKDSDVVLMGDSAGGGFVLGLAQELDRLKFKEAKSLIVMSPWVDLTMENLGIEKYQKVDPWLNSKTALPTAKAWANGTDLKDPKLSPIYGNLKALKNLTIFTGTRDILYPDIQVLADKLKEENIDFEYIIGKNLNHVYPLFPIPEGQEAIDKIAKILEK